MENNSPIEELVHLYVDGAFNRRELMEKVSKYAGGWAAALAAMTALGVSAEESAPAQSLSCPADPRVPENATDLQARSVTFAGEGGSLFGYLAYPNPVPATQQPGILVIHENRGLVEHIKDVTRRCARAGFVALGVDLLSRQGGTDSFPDATTQQQAYGRTTQFERRVDILSSLDYLKHQPMCKFDRIGTVGFCAGGGNVWDFVLAVEELKAAVVFYGTPVPPVDLLDLIQTPVLANYAELDRTLSLSMPNVITGMLTRQKKFSFRLYEGVGHAFNNDTGPAYNAAAACEAWSASLAWFNKFLRA
jgi:carboxymethylenebutenolidase